MPGACQVLDEHLLRHLLSGVADIKMRSQDRLTAATVRTKAALLEHIAMSSSIATIFFTLETIRRLDGHCANLQILK